ncbi:hypothetical protein PchlR47_18315 [Pseudomonas chlororaphis]|nr:hypothetical protein PchlR47_18315 [Pseudomonas chlororaphis]
MKIGRLICGWKAQLPEPPLNSPASSRLEVPALAVRLTLGKNAARAAPILALAALSWYSAWRMLGRRCSRVYSGTSFGDSRATAIETLVPADVAVLNQLYYVDSATPVVGRNMLLRYRNIDLDAQVNGVSDQYFQVRGLKLATGIAFSESDARRQAQVVVIDHNARHRLFGPGEDPLGQVILVGNLPCTVIGVTAENKNMFATSKALNVWVPYETAAGRLLGQRYLDSISDIRQQFLVEAVMVCLIGGMIGISLSYAIGYLFSLFVKEWEMVFSLGSIVTAFACSTLIGIVFGFVPARNAARLDPIEALARD